jgi:tryptophan synthase beta chain
MDVHSVSAGLDYPGVGPEHSYWKDTGRVNYVTAGDEDALEMYQKVARLEGILPAVESSHALAQAVKSARQRSKDEAIVVCLSGRGDKDVNEVARILGLEF